MPKVLPSAPEAEASLLGTMMVYPNAARIAMEEGVSEDDFFIETNKRVFQACESLYKTGSPIDLTTVATRLKDMNLLEKAGGISYLTDLSDAAVTSANTKNYVTMIHEKALMRNMIEAAEGVAEEGFAGQTDVNEYLDRAEKEILNVSRNRRAGEFKTSPELMTNVLDMIQKMSDNKSDITGYKTGFFDLDHTLHGLQKGDLIIIAARPSMGKTAVALNLAMNVAAYQPEQAVAIFSLEMAAEQLAMRLLSAKSRIPGDQLKTGRLSNDDWNRVNEAAAELKMSNIFIDDTPGVKTSEIFSKCRRLQSEHGLSLILIDYIQLITGSGRAGENRQQEVSEISRNLKALARELSVPVIALSQLSRSVEQRENKHPMLSDLRESGAIEQDADIVMMLFREAYYDEKVKEEAEQAGNERLEINIAKHRNGATRKVFLAFEGATNALYNIVNAQ
ncbi:MAG: replicative DNA helicase [Solobacterium sp.]|nr:replicative DNA helicase [Solobacterium sp.]